jgi:hypothetical protein
MVAFLVIGFVELELHHSAVQMNPIRWVLLRRSCLLPAVFASLSLRLAGFVPIFAARPCLHMINSVY